MELDRIREEVLNKDVAEVCCCVVVMLGLSCVLTVCWFVAKLQRNRKIHKQQTVLRFQETHASSTSG